MKNNLEKVIITGGAGFIGSNLAEHLFKNGTKEILIIDDFSTGSKKNIEHLKNINIINDRIEDIEDLETRLKFNRKTFNVDSPFYGECVVIDEVHNFVREILNPASKPSKVFYNWIINAENEALALQQFDKKLNNGEIKAQDEPLYSKDRVFITYEELKNGTTGVSIGETSTRV